MIYKFDIMFSKELKGGGVKVITYRQLLTEPTTFGEGESLDDAVGTLSLNDNGIEKGYSISTLFIKYRSELVGYHKAELFGKEFPLRFVFGKDDVHSLRAEIKDENGILYSSDVQTLQVNGTMTLPLKDVDSFVAIVPKGNGCVVSDDDGSVELHVGELAIVPASDDAITLSGQVDVITIKCI